MTTPRKRTRKPQAAKAEKIPKENATVAIPESPEPEEEATTRMKWVSVMAYNSIVGGTETSVLVGVSKHYQRYSTKELAFTASETGNSRLSEKKDLLGYLRVRKLSPIYLTLGIEEYVALRDRLNP